MPWSMARTKSILFSLIKLTPIDPITSSLVCRPRKTACSLDLNLGPNALSSLSNKEVSSAPSLPDTKSSKYCWAFFVLDLPNCANSPFFPR